VCGVRFLEADVRACNSQGDDVGHGGGVRRLGAEKVTWWMDGEKRALRIEIDGRWERAEVSDDLVHAFEQKFHRDRYLPELCETVRWCSSSDIHTQGAHLDRLRLSCLRSAVSLLALSVATAAW
jgi:hypothetical protein